jgi:hypothetical protein
MSDNEESTQDWRDALTDIEAFAIALYSEGMWKKLDPGVQATYRLHAAAMLSERSEVVS